MTSAIDGVAAQGMAPESQPRAEDLVAGVGTPEAGNTQASDGERFRLVLSEVEGRGGAELQGGAPGFGERIQGLLEIDGVRTAQMRDLLESIGNGEFTRAADEARSRADQIVDIARSQSFESEGAYQSNLQQARSEAGMIRMEGNMQSHAEMIGAQTGLTLQVAMMSFVKNVSSMAVQGFNKVISGR